jgi:hypothetical protein
MNLANCFLFLALLVVGVACSCARSTSRSTTAIDKAQALLAAGKHEEAHQAYTDILKDVIAAGGPIDSPEMMQVHVALVKCQLKAFGPDQGLVAAHLLISNFSEKLSSDSRDDLAAWLEAEGAAEAAAKVRPAK